MVASGNTLAGADSATTDDNLYGGSGNDTLNGTAGDNILDGGTGADTIYSGTGSDVIVIRSGDGGSSISDADTLVDFSDGVDAIGLDSSLGFSDLTIAASGSDTIKVADGVTFVATANIGNEYTSTRVMDKALMDRFTIVEMDVLTEQDEATLLGYMFPSVDEVLLGNVAKIATLTRTESNSETARITSGISTRTTVELCGLLYDGFSLEESAEVSIYPQYDSTGGVDSERTFVKQIVQKFCDDGSSDDLFNEEEMSEATEDDSY